MLIAVTVFDLPKLKSRKQQIDALLLDPKVYGDLQQSIKLNKELASIQSDLDMLNSLGERIQFVRDGLNECGEDADMLSLFEDELKMFYTVDEKYDGRVSTAICVDERAIEIAEEKILEAMENLEKSN